MHILASLNFHAQVVNYTRNSRTVSIFPYSKETVVMALRCNQLNLALSELHHHMISIATKSQEFACDTRLSIISHAHTLSIIYLTLLRLVLYI